jgi:hypothetical protein
VALWLTGNPVPPDLRDTTTVKANAIVAPLCVAYRFGKNNDRIAATENGAIRTMVCGAICTYVPITTMDG